MVVLDDVEFLYAKALTGTHDRAGVLGLVDIFQDDSDMAGSLAENFCQAFSALLINEPGQVIDDVLLFFRCHAAGYNMPGRYLRTNAAAGDCPLPGILPR